MKKPTDTTPKPKPRRRATAAADATAAAPATKPRRERKPNWSETTASVADIKAWLEDNVMLRYNLVTGQPELHRLSTGPQLATGPDGQLAITPGQPGTDGYRPLDDRDENSLWVEMSADMNVNPKALSRIIHSDFVPDYHPFRHYLQTLPTWTDQDDDYIMELSLTVNVRGDADEQLRFYEYLKKWLVAMVASWADDRVVNNTMLVLIGRQGAYKTTWFAHLLPPELRAYFYTKTNASIVSKDDLLVLARYGLVCWEELDTMQPKELNNLKGAMTMPSINERAAYERYHRNRPHVASFCGTGNNIQFLSDTTGTRRWLPFEVDTIENPIQQPFRHTGIYAQAYTLWRQGFRYWFEHDEIISLRHHNRQYETASTERELVFWFFRPPRDGEQGEFMPVALAMQIVSGQIAAKVSKEQMGRAFIEQGFERKTYRNVRGYVVVRRTPSEIQQLRDSLAANTHTPDTPVF